MLQPKKQKFRKQQKGRSRRRMVETRGLTLGYGSIGLQAMTSAWIKSNQIEAARKAISNSMKREGRIWIRVFPDKPVTSLPPEVTLGGGKGDISHYVFPVKPGRMLFEVDGVSKEVATIALRLAGHKLPMKTRIVTK